MRAARHGQCVGEPIALPPGSKEHPVPKLKQPVTDDSLKVRQVTHYQFSYVAGEAGEGAFTLQLVLDVGAWEEVMTVAAEDAEVLQNLLRRTETVFYDIGRQTLMFGTEPAGG
jgi:hypothetical protein